MAIVVLIERPHESSTQLLNPVAIDDACVRGERVVVSDESGRTVFPEQVRNQGDRVAVADPSVRVDLVLDLRTVAQSLDCVVTLPIRCSRGIGAEAEEFTTLVYL